MTAQSLSTDAQAIVDGNRAAIRWRDNAILQHAMVIHPDGTLHCGRCGAELTSSPYIGCAACRFRICFVACCPPSGPLSRLAKRCEAEFTHLTFIGVVEPSSTRPEVRAEGESTYTISQLWVRP